MSTFSGILIGLTAGGLLAAVCRSKRKKRSDKCGVTEELEKKKNKKSSHGNDENYIPADIAFKENLNRFVILLDGVSKNEIRNKAQWTDVIISTNNNDLIELWRAANNRPDLWVTYLQTFGLQMDWVDTFEAAEYHKEMYDDKTGLELQIGKNYKVLSACWILTDENNLKSVAKKGVVSQI